MHTSTCLLLLALGASLSGSEAPYGHRDFYPSPERPAGYRGDGNGFFPGATPVTHWAEGTLVKKSFTYPGKRGQETSEAWDFADSGAVNVVWRRRMPGWVNGHPIVVGDRVFTAGEPWLLTCVDAHSGEILWTRENSPWHGLGLPEDGSQRLAELGHLAYLMDALGDFFKDARSLSADKVPPVAQLLLESELSALQRVLARLDPQGDYDGTFVRARQSLEFLAKGDLENKAVGKNANFDAIAKAIGQRLEAICGKAIHTTWSWGTMVGNCMSSPVSDGRQVYMTTGNGAVAAYDLNGRKVWSRYVDPDMKRINTSMIQSPLIAGGVLVVMVKRSTLVGLDTRTGEPLWEAPTQAEGVAAKKGGYYVGGHKIVYLGDGEQCQAVVVTSLCNIIRTDDGKVVGKLPYTDDYGPSGGSSILASGDIVYKGCCGDGGGAPLHAYQLERSGDQVQATEIWTAPTKPPYHGLIATPQWLIWPSNGRDGNVFDARSGQVLDTTQRAAEQQSWILAGDVLLSMPNGDGDRLYSHWGGNLRGDGKQLTTFRATAVGADGALRPTGQESVLGTTETPPMSYLERWAPELATCRDFISGGGRGGVLPGQFLHTDTAIFPSGNRLFIRSCDALYCIGDPSVTYDWNPDSRPADIARSLK